MIHHAIALKGSWIMWKSFLAFWSSKSSANALIVIKSLLVHLSPAHVAEIKAEIDKLLAIEREVTAVAAKIAPVVYEVAPVVESAVPSIAPMVAGAEKVVETVSEIPPVNDSEVPF